MSSHRWRFRIHLAVFTCLVSTWALSYRFGVGLEMGSTGRTPSGSGRMVALALGGGRVSLEFQSGIRRFAYAMWHWEPAQGPPAFIQFRHKNYPGVPWFGIYAKYTRYQLIGFQYFRVTGQAWYPEGRALVIPMWFLVVLASIRPATRIATWLRSRRTARQRSLGLCVRCGYDLRASAERCPECGEPISSGPA